MNIHLLRSHIEKIVPLSDEEFALVASYFVERSLKKHQFLVQESAQIPYEIMMIGILMLDSTPILMYITVLNYFF